MTDERESDPISPTDEALLAKLLEGLDLAILDGGPEAMRKALDCFSTAVLIDDTRPEPHLGMGFCYSNLGDETRAVRSFDACLERGFGSDDFPCMVYEFDNDDCMTEVVEIGPAQVMSWRANCHLALGRVDAALRDLDRIGEPDDLALDAEVTVLRARVCLVRGDQEGARRQLSRALGFDPANPDAHFLRGRLHELGGDPDAALKAYRKACRLDPEEIDFRIAAAGSYLEHADPDAAARELAIARTLLAGQFPQPARVAQLDALQARIDATRD